MKTQEVIFWLSQLQENCTNKAQLEALELAIETLYREERLLCNIAERT